MNRLIMILALSLPLIMSFNAPPDPKPAILKVQELVQRYSNKSDTTYVINFWATWCAPCIKELPYFEQINNDYLNKKVKVILVSIDFVADYDSKLVKFLKRKDIKSEVVLLDETKPNEFIDKISPVWNGSVPATMIVNNAMSYKAFFEQEVNYEFLETKVKALTN